jgi:4-hydroxy-tetrahydrodipicolinate synthase
MKSSVAGVVTALITPFNTDNSVDYPALETIVEFLIQKKVNALFPCGTTGEMFKMSEEERKKVAETVIKAAARRVPVIIHVGAMDQATTIRLAQHAEKAGADYIASVTPSYFGANAKEIEEFYVSIANSVSKNFPLYLYNIPQLSGNMLTADIVRKVSARCENVVGVKYSNSDLLLTYDYLVTKDGFSVLQGTDRCFLPAMLMGCAGTVSGISCVYPEPFVALFAAYSKGDLKRAKELQVVATDYCNILKHGSNMAYFKAGLEYRGLPGGHMRQPHLDLEEGERLAFIEGLKTLNKKHEFLFS